MTRIYWWVSSFFFWCRERERESFGWSRWRLWLRWREREREVSWGERMVTSDQIGTLTQQASRDGFREWDDVRGWRWLSVVNQEVFASKTKALQTSLRFRWREMILRSHSFKPHRTVSSQLRWSQAPNCYFPDSFPLGWRSMSFWGKLINFNNRSVHTPFLFFLFFFSLSFFSLFLFFEFAERYHITTTEDHA